MGKKFVAACAVLCLMALLLPCALTAQAAETVLTTENSSLFLPESYEQYLTLDNPVDIAVSEHYIAIAEKTALYVFDRKESHPVYHKYTHTDEQISKIQFSENERLYFSDTHSRFYELDLNDLSNLQVTDSEFHAGVSTFYINGDTLFEVSVTEAGITIYSASLSDPNQSEQFGKSKLKNTPLLTYDNGILYTVVEKFIQCYTYNIAHNKYEQSTSHAIQASISGVTSACALGGKLYLSVNGSSADGNGLYSFDLSTKDETLLFHGSGYGALTSYNGKLYCVKGNTILEYEPTEDGLTPTSYEIASSSASQNRLSGAQDIARAGGLLVIADAGNQRISIAVLDHDEGDTRIAYFSVMPCLDDNEKPFTPNLVATDGNIIAVSSSHEKKTCIYLYRFGDPNFFDCHTLNEKVIDIACARETCYYITEHGYGKIKEGVNTLVSHSEYMPVALAADEYGALYVVNADGSVHIFAETDFVDCPVFHCGETFSAISQPVSSLCADNDGNLYYIIENMLYKNDDPLLCFDGQSLVFGGINFPVAFAIDHEYNEAFLLYDNYIVKSVFDDIGR